MTEIPYRPWVMCHQLLSLQLQHISTTMCTTREQPQDVSESFRDTQVRRVWVEHFCKAAVSKHSSTDLIFFYQVKMQNISGFTHVVFHFYMIVNWGFFFTSEQKANLLDITAGQALGHLIYSLIACLQKSLGMHVCVRPPTFNWLLDFSVLPLDLVHHFVLLLLLLPLSVFDLLLLLPLLSVSLLRLVLVGVLCGSREREESFRSGQQTAGALRFTHFTSIYSRALLTELLPSSSPWPSPSTFPFIVSVFLLQSVLAFPSLAATNSSLRRNLPLVLSRMFLRQCNDLPVPFKTAAVALQLPS